MFIYQLNLYLIFFIFLSIIFYLLIYLNRSIIGNTLKTNDKPDYKRKIHKNITPRTSVYSFAIILFLILISNFFFEFIDKDYNLIILTSLLAFLIGIVDDRFELKPLKKIFFLTIVSIIAITSSENLIIKKVYIITYDTFFNFGNFSIPFTILCILLLSNAMNLTDGINGIATGLFINFFIYLIVSSKNQDLLFFCHIIIFNLVLIFYHNYKGMHFLGDAGVMLLSTLLGLLMIKLNSENLIVPNFQFSAEQLFILLMIPGLDMFRLFLKRLLKKQNPFAPDNSHFHHYLIKKLSLIKTLALYLFLVNIPLITSYNNIFKPIYVILFTLITFFMLVVYFRYKDEN